MSSEELAAAEMYFSCTKFVRDIPQGSTVIPRYTLQEPVREVYLEEINRGHLRSLNSERAAGLYHNIRNWYPVFQDLTPQTWFQEQYPTFLRHERGSFVVKGLVKSRKDNWKDLMFADSPRQAFDRVVRLQEDGGEACIRRYVPLMRCGEGINGIPITREYRCFILDKKLMYAEYYWGNCLELVPESWLGIPADSEFKELLEELMSRETLGRWYVADVAQAEDGSWLLVEINDAQQAGVPTLDAQGYRTFYRKLWEGLW